MKKVLITGSSGSIGSAISKLFYENNWEVYGTYRLNEKHSDESAMKYFHLDLSDKTSIKKLVEKIDNIDAVVNNAGINIPNDFDKISLEDWDKIFSVNTRGLFYLTQSIGPKINKNGSIVNIASFSGQVGGPRTTHYAASKAAVISLTQNMARFFCKDGIRVNCVSPGVIESELAKAAKNLPILNDILLGRLGLPSEVAHLVKFLCDENSKYITAQTININGGLYF